MENNSKIKIAVLVDKEIPTDHSFIQGVLEKSMLNENCEVTFVGYASNAAPVVNDERVRFLTVPDGPSNFFLKKIDKLKSFSAKIEESGPYDVLFTRNDPVFLIIAKQLKAKKSVKLHFHQISHLHAFAKGNVLYKIKAFGDKLLRKTYLKYADRILVISEQMKTFLDKEWPMFSDKYIVYPLGVEVGDFENPKPYAERSHDVVYIGTLAGSRRVDVMIDAVKIYNEKYGPLVLDIWGASHNPQDDENLKQHAQNRGIVDKIKFHGKISRQEVLAKLKDTKIGLSAIPSTGILNQISPTKLMEYLAAGSCVIATGGIKDQVDIINEAYGGGLINFNAEEIAEAIHNILNDNNKAEALSQQGREYILEKRSYKTMAQKLRAEMQQLL